MSKHLVLSLSPARCCRAAGSPSSPLRGGVRRSSRSRRHRRRTPPRNSSADDVGLGLTPGTPVVGTLPGGVRARLRAAPGRRGEAASVRLPRLHHDAAARRGCNRAQALVTTEQKNVASTRRPVVPDYPDSPRHASVVPQPYAQLAFSYGNQIVSGTAIIKAWTATTATSFFDPTLPGRHHRRLRYLQPPQPGQERAPLDQRGRLLEPLRHDGRVRSKATTPRPSSAAPTASARTSSRAWRFGDFVLAFEQGFQGQLDKTPIGLTSDGWNGFADPNTGTGLVMHEHLGVSYRRQLTLGLHHMVAWSQDDRASQAFTPDGSITVLGADLRFSASHLGHAYLGASYTLANNAALGGSDPLGHEHAGRPDLDAQLPRPGQRRDGKILTIGAEYGLSLAPALLPARLRREVARHHPLGVRDLLARRQRRSEVRRRQQDQVRRRGQLHARVLVRRLVRADHVRPTMNVDGREFTILSLRPDLPHRLAVT